MPPVAWSSFGRTVAPLPEAPAALARTDPTLTPVTARLEREGVSIDPDTLTPDWRGERLDLDWTIHVLWRPRSQAEGRHGRWCR